MYFTIADNVKTPLKHLFLIQSGVRTIMIDRPSRFNAFNDELYRAFPRALKEASNDWPRTKVTVLAGNPSSPWYSSGNDLTDFVDHFSVAPDISKVNEIQICFKNSLLYYTCTIPGLL